MLILFNFEGTLVHKASEQYRRYVEACECLEIDPQPEEDYFALMNEEKPLEELHAEQAQEIAQVMETIMEQDPVARMNLKKLFTSLQKQGHQVGVLTSKDASVHEYLESLGVKHMLDIIKCSTDTYVQKPDPAVFDAVYEEGFDPGNIIYIGDTLSDMRAAREAGIRFLGIVSDINGHRHFKEEGLEENEILYSLAEILNYLQQENETI